MDKDQPHTELLEPVNLHLNIKRNLAASWYKKMAAVEVDGDLKPMKVGRGRVCVCVRERYFLLIYLKTTSDRRPVLGLLNL